MLAGGVDVRGRRVGDHNAALGRGLDVHVVQSDAGATDDLQILGGLEHFLIHRGGGAHEQGVGIDDGVKEFWPVRAIHPTDLDGIAECIDGGLRELICD